MNRSNRRRFLKNATILAPVLMIRPSSLSSKSSRLRIALIGAGAWGRQYLSLALQHSQIDVRAICDQDATALQHILPLYKKAAHTQHYHEILQRTDIDAVIIATPWQQHYSIARAALLAGKHVACGLVMGTTVEEHLDIVALCQQTGRHYFTLDEHSYRPDLLAISHMIHNGLFGHVESIRAGASYQSLHTATAPTVYPVYPGLAVAGMAGIQHNNQYVSVRALQQQQEYVQSKPHSKTGIRRMMVTQGNVNTICVTTGLQQMIHLQSHANQAQPFSTGFKVKGSAMHWMDISRSIRINNNTAWQSDEPYLNQYRDPLYLAGIKSYKQLPVHEGMALALHHFVQVVQEPAIGHLPVYIAAANSMIGPLAALSLQNGGAEIAFPGFSQGRIAAKNNS